MCVCVCLCLGLWKSGQQSATATPATRSHAIRRKSKKLGLSFFTQFSKTYSKCSFDPGYRLIYKTLVLALVHETESLAMKLSDWLWTEQSIPVLRHASRRSHSVHWWRAACQVEVAMTPNTTPTRSLPSVSPLELAEFSGKAGLRVLI